MEKTLDINSLEFSDKNPWINKLSPQISYVLESTKKLIDENKNEIELSQDLMNFITNMQDEVHRVAIEYNRSLRNKDTTKSKLDSINGIGEKRKQELLKKFGSVEGIKKADILEIMEVKGITEELARKIKKELIRKL